MPFTISMYSLAGLLLMGGLGLVLLGTYQRWYYPAQRRAHEKAKVTASHGKDPNTFKIVIKIISLLVLPAIGFVLGDFLLAPTPG